nr:hypothetical protein [Tanacetum cinerariifolium]
MSTLNTDNTLQTQTSNALHNAIMEASGKDRQPMLAPEGSPKTRVEGYMETCKNVSQVIRDQLDGEDETVQIILTQIDNDIYTTVDACPNACEMWKAIQRLKQGESINVQDLETNLYWEFGKFTSRDGESLESYYLRQQAVNKNKGKAIVNSSPPTYDQEPDTVTEDDALSKEKEIDKLMALISLSLEKIYKPTNNNLKTSSNNNDQEAEAHYMYMIKIQEVSTDAEDSGPIFNVEPLDKTLIINSLDMSHYREHDDQDDNDDLAKEREFLTSLIRKVKCEIDDNQNRNKLLESSNKLLVDKLIRQIKDFKNKNISLESSNNHFKEANNELLKTNKLMYKDLKKFQDELEKHRDVNYMSKVEFDYAKAKEGSPKTRVEGYMETCKNVSQDIRDQLDGEDETVQIILTQIDNDIYTTVDACLNACEMWKAIQRLKQGESINVQDLKTNLYWEFGKFTSRDGESLESYYSRQQAVNRNKGKEIVNSSPPTYDQEPDTVSEDDALSKEKEINKLMALISLSLEKIYKPTNNNLKTSSNNKSEHAEQLESIIDTYLDEQTEKTLIINSLDMSHYIEHDDHDDNDDLAKEREFLTSLIEKVKCEIDDNQNRNKLLESSNKLLVDKLIRQIKDFKNKNISLESSNNHFKEENNELLKTNKLMYKDLKKFQDKLEKHRDVNYMSKVEFDCAKAKGDLMSYKMESQKSFNEYTQKINDLNQMTLEIKKELVAHQETIYVMSQEKETQEKFYKTREENEIEKVIVLGNKLKVLNDIVYKTS